MRAFEFTKPLTIQQSREKALKQQAKNIDIRLKQERLLKQRERARAAAQALARAQSQTF
jgi:hypothetical protein